MQRSIVLVQNSPFFVMSYLVSSRLDPSRLVSSGRMPHQLLECVVKQRLNHGVARTVAAAVVEITAMTAQNMAVKKDGYTKDNTIHSSSSFPFS
jgi:hypothetical protein